MRILNFSEFLCIDFVALSLQAGGGKQVRMWLDESLNSFFRRLCFTPDGSFLIAPSQSNISLSCSFAHANPSYVRVSVQVGGQKLEKSPKTPPTSLLEATSLSMCFFSQTIRAHTYNNFILALNLPLPFPLQTSASAAWPREADCVCAVLPSLV